MAIALINTAAPVGGATGATTSAANMVGSSLLVACVAASTGSPTMSDSSGNTWTGPINLGAANINALIFYCFSPTTTSSQTFTISGSLGTIGVYGFRGAATSSGLDQQNGSGSFGFTTSIQAGSITPVANGEVIIALLALTQSNSTPTINSSFGTVSYSNASAGEGLGMSLLVQTTAGAINPTWAYGGSFPTAAGIVSFKASAATANIFGRSAVDGLSTSGKIQFTRID